MNQNTKMKGKRGKLSYRKILQSTGTVFGLFLAAFAVFPRGISYSNEGIWLLFMLGISFSLFCFFYKKFGKLLRFTLSLGFLLGALFLTICIILLYTVPKSFDGSYDGQTVIVLGAKVVGDQPASMLKSRLDGALLILKENPDAPCIVTGGQGADELYPEAEVMAKYLQKNGIGEERIYMESRSVNTAENLTLAKDIIQKEQLSIKVLVATNDFHQYRAQLICKSLSLDCEAVSVSTKFSYSVFFAVREVFSVLKWMITAAI